MDYHNCTCVCISVGDEFAACYELRNYQSDTRLRKQQHHFSWRTVDWQEPPCEDSTLVGTFHDGTMKQGRRRSGSSQKSRNFATTTTSAPRVNSALSWSGRQNTNKWLRSIDTQKGEKKKLPQSIHVASSSVPRGWRWPALRNYSSCLYNSVCSPMLSGGVEDQSFLLWQRIHTRSIVRCAHHLPQFS